MVAVSSVTFASASRSTLGWPSFVLVHEVEMVLVFVEDDSDLFHDIGGHLRSTLVLALERLPVPLQRGQVVDRLLVGTRRDLEVSRTNDPNEQRDSEHRMTPN